MSAGVKGLWRRLDSLEAVRVGALPLLVLVVALFFAFPWLPEPSPAGPALERYSPTRDGGSLLIEAYDADGKQVSTESQNLAMIPDLRSFTESSQALNSGLEEAYGSPENMEDAQVMEVRRRTLDESGEVSDTTDTMVLEPRGLLLLASREGAAGTEFVFDRPAILLPSDLAPGKTWRSEGKAGSLDYELDGRVTDGGAYDGDLGSFDDCLSVETETTFSQPGRPGERTGFEDTYCAGVGLVESREFDGSGDLVRRSTVVATDLAPARRKAKLPPTTFEPDTGVSGDPASWRLGHFGRLRPTEESTPSTIAPTYLPTDPPVVLAAAQEGDLLALDAGENPGRIRWRFHPEGTIYGPPAFDAKTGRVFFGATDKKLYALDARGLFLWAFETGDNVASRPVVAGDTVVFGGENRNIYGLDAATGERRWAVRTGGPVVSSPAFEEGMVIIGSDDGAVYGLDPSTGREEWRYIAGGPVEATVTAVDGVAYVASRSGELTALDAETGKEIWTSQKGEILRTAPAVGAAEVFVVDDAQGLLAFDRRTGKKRWGKPNGSYVGPPLIARDELLVARNDGSIQRIGFDGGIRDVWDGAVAGNPLDGDPSFYIGPTSGGGALWVASDKAAVLRLGRKTGPAHIEPVWADAFANPPFTGDAPQYTAAAYRGEALMLGAGNNIYRLDVDSGEARRVGALDDASGSPRSEPVVAGDTLLAASGDALHAVHLPDTEGLWRYEAGPGLRPPVVAGQKVLWLSSPGSEGTLSALDLSTGEELWKTALPGAGGVVVRGNTAYASPASAFDLDSGERLWRSESAGASASGGPALSASGDVLFAGTASGDEPASVVAVDSTNGEEVWSADLEGDAVDPSDRLRVSGDLVVIPLLLGDVVALDARTGEEVWRYEPPSPRFGNVTVEGGRVCFALQDGEVLALDAESGEISARSNDYSLNLSGTNLDQRPVFVGGTLVLGVGTYVFGFEPPDEVAGP